MAIDSFFQASILTNFVYPFLLIFFVLFALLEKTNLLGQGQRQINALVSFIIGLIFVSAVLPKLIIGNLVLVLSILLVLIFVIFVIVGFISGKEVVLGGKPGIVIGILIALLFVGVILYTAHLEKPIHTASNNFFNFLFYSSWSSSFWQNVLFIIIIALALAVVLRKPPTPSS